MACSSPLYGFRMLDVDPNTGELFHYRFRKNEEMRFDGDTRIKDDKFQFVSKTYFPTEEDRMAYWQRIKNTPGYETALIPCGRCLECRLEYSRQWANRCMLEASVHPDNWFITLTYDDEHLPLNSKGFPTLNKDEISIFIKNLRRYFDYHFKHNNIRFFGCGEYGETTARPHYHVLIFNLPLMDLNYMFTKNNNAYFESLIVNKIWDKGFAVISDVSWDTCAYTARYVVKKAKGETASVYSELDIVPEYVRMSRDPGIGKAYFDSHKDLIYRYDKLTIPGVGPIRPSRYYDKLYDLENPARLFELKEKRIAVAEGCQAVEMANTSLSPLDYMHSKHELLVKKIESLKRDEI